MIYARLRMIIAGEKYTFYFELIMILDVAFNEDYSRKRTGNAAKNFTNINRVALSMVRRSEKKVSIVNKRFAAGWDNNYLLSLLII